MTEVEELNKKPEVKIIFDLESLEDQVQISHIIAELYVILQNLKVSEPSLLVRHEGKVLPANEFAIPILVSHILSELIESNRDDKLTPELIH